MADVEKYKIPLFDGSNFGNWKFRMETLLNELDLLDFVRLPYYSMIELLESDSAAVKAQKEMELKNLEKRDRKCCSQIIQRVADSHLEYVKDCDSAHGIWSVLIETFERKSIASQLLLRKKLLLMKFHPNRETMANHLLTFDKVIRELRATGAKLEETDLVCHLLLTMPTEFNHVVTVIETLSTENLTIGFVKNRLMDEEVKRMDLGKKKQVSAEPSNAFSVRSNKFNTTENTSKGGENKFKIQCHKCGGFGHKRADCKRKENSQNNHSKSANAAVSAQKEDKTNTEFCFSAHINDCQIFNWALDSGATEHLGNENTPMKNIKSLKYPVKIRVAKSGVTLQADKFGEVKVCCIVKGKKNYITIKEVLLVPGLDHNLLSVRKLEKNGFRVIFENGKGIIEKNGLVAAVATISNKQLYVLDLHEEENAFFSECIKTWHMRLGHLRYASVKKLPSLVEGMNLNSNSLSPNVCKVCVEGKQTKLPHNQPRNRATRALELVHSDLMGPIKPTSYDDCNYIIMFLDDYTHFTAAYLLRSKTEVFHYFKIYEAMATAHFNCKLSRFRCDNGREYMSNEMKHYFEEKGITIEFTIRYTPKQNGVAERLNRTICEKARCLLLNSELGKGFWSDAVRTAIFLLNRSPTSALNGEVPATLWYGVKPNLKKLKVFGCLAYLHLPKQLIVGKFDSRTVPCLGTSQTDTSFGVRRIIKSTMEGTLNLTKQSSG